MSRQRRSGCWHLRVFINRIDKAKNPKTGNRIIGGDCQNCYRRVSRVDGPDATDWMLTP